MIIERDRRRAVWIEEQLGSVVINAPADEGKYQIQAGCQRADAVLAVTGDDEDNLIISQLAKLKCGANRVIARVNNPKNEIVFKAMGIDETLSSTRVLMGVIEQELPTGGVHALLPPTPAHPQIVAGAIAARAPPAHKEVEGVGLPAAPRTG